MRPDELLLTDCVAGQCNTEGWRKARLHLRIASAVRPERLVGEFSRGSAYASEGSADALQEALAKYRRSFEHTV